MYPAWTQCQRWHFILKSLTVFNFLSIFTISNEKVMKEKIPWRFCLFLANSMAWTHDEKRCIMTWSAKLIRPIQYHHKSTLIIDLRHPRGDKRQNKFILSNDRYCHVIQIAYSVFSFHGNTSSNEQLHLRQINKSYSLRSSWTMNTRTVSCSQSGVLAENTAVGAQTQVHRPSPTANTLCVPSHLLHLPPPSLSSHYPPSLPSPPHPSLSLSLIQMQRAVSNRMRADLIQKASLKISASRI